MCGTLTGCVRTSGLGEGRIVVYSLPEAGGDAEHGCRLGKRMWWWWSRGKQHTRGLRRRNDHPGRFRVGGRDQGFL